MYAVYFKPIFTSRTLPNPLELLNPLGRKMALPFN